ncbi:MAG: rhodanese-like domain-containing protein [Bacteroidota bacterium]|jgi:thioredoxin
MRIIFYISFFCLLAGVFSCQNQASHSNTKTINTSITVDEFEKKLLSENAQLIDVRTPEEFNQGHVKGALNYNINDAEFENQLSKLDKNKPVLVYCLSGGRSGSAAEIIAGRGFKEVYNMQGGIMKWNAANKTLDDGKVSAKNKGMTEADFNQLLESDKFVLVDYNAKWCKPCLRMAPMLDAFMEKRKEKLVLVKIDADENKNLLKQRGIESLPVLELFKDGKLIWKHEGEINETTLSSETKL